MRFSSPKIRCGQCEKEFKISPSRVGKRKFCSKPCFDLFQTGKPQSPNNLINRRSFSGENNPFYGKKHTEETRKILSEKRLGKSPANKGKPAPWAYETCRQNKLTGRLRGSNHYKWSEDTPEKVRIRNSQEYHKWRTEVYKRDNYTCVLCNQRGVRLNADHIKPFTLFPELRLEVSNGRTLCVPCHKATPTYGRKVQGLTRADFELE